MNNRPAHNFLFSRRPSVHAQSGASEEGRNNFEPVAKSWMGKQGQWKDLVRHASEKEERALGKILLLKFLFLRKACKEKNPKKSIPELHAAGPVRKEKSSCLPLLN